MLNKDRGFGRWRVLRRSMSHLLRSFRLSSCFGGDHPDAAAEEEDRGPRDWRDHSLPPAYDLSSRVYDDPPPYETRDEVAGPNDGNDEDDVSYWDPEDDPEPFSDVIESMITPRGWVSRPPESALPVVCLATINEVSALIYVRKGSCAITRDFVVPVAWTVAQLKDAFAELEQVNRSRLRFIFAGHEPNDDWRLDNPFFHGLSEFTLHAVRMCYAPTDQGW